MSTSQFLRTQWNLNPGLIAGCLLALAAYFAWAGRGRLAWGRAAAFAGGVVLVFLTLASPLNRLADGYLFTAHMAQHLLLLLIAPALLVMGLPDGWSPAPAVRSALHPVLTWAAGVGSMWFWHIPSLCNAATESRPIHALQSLSLIALGAAFWWPIAAPRAADRLHALGGIVYLFTACLTCTALGIIITLTPIEVCPIFRSPADPLHFLGTIRDRWGFSADLDREMGGLLMWVPMCLVYLCGIFVELARWFRAANAAVPEPHTL